MEKKFDIFKFFFKVYILTNPEKMTIEPRAICHIDTRIHTNPQYIQNEAQQSQIAGGIQYNIVLQSEKSPALYVILMIKERDNTVKFVHVLSSFLSINKII